MKMMDRVFELPAQLRWGVELTPPEVPTGASVLLLGMGGSGMAARVGALRASQEGAFAMVHQGYDLPGWATEVKPLVVAVSFSGNTEETLSGVEAAVAAGLNIAVVSSGGRLAELAADRGFPFLGVPGGMQPRAALGYQAAAVLSMLHKAGAMSDPRAQLEEAASVVDELLGAGSGAGYALGADIAAALDGRVVLVYGGRGIGALAASRWKAQVNENAKTPAFASEIPEANHNELQGWDALALLGERTLGFVMLHDSQDHPRVQLRASLTTEMTAARVTFAGEVRSQGEGMLARLFSMMAVGDVASVVLADRMGIDATSIPALNELKQRLLEG